MAQEEKNTGDTMTVQFVRDSLAREIGPGDTPFKKNKTYTLNPESALRWLMLGAATTVERKAKK